MLKKIISLFAFAMLFACIAAAQDAATVINNSSKAMGADNLKTLEFTGSGWEYAFGQAVNPKSPWPGFEVKTYTRTTDFEAPAWHIERVLVPPAPTRRGGGLPPAQSQSFVINANTNWAQQADHWTMTPFAFLRIAAASSPTVASRKVGGKNEMVISFTAPSKAKVNGYINEQNMVEKVETWIDNPVTGDTLFEADYSGYKDFGGLKFPTRIVRKQGDYPVLDLSVTGVTPNAPVNIQAPPAAGGPPPATVSRALGDGVYLILGGYASIAVDFKDYIVVLEGGNSEANASAIIAEAKRLIPNKPIRYMFNTHGHFDHTSGMRRFMAEGATIITSAQNKDYFEKLAGLPHTLSPDLLASSPKKISIEGIADKKTLTDGNHVIELYRLQGSTHNDGLFVAYLPKEKVLLEADAWNAPAEADAPPAPLNSSSQNLMDNIQRLKLDIETIVPVHYPANNRPVAMAEFTKAFGKASN